MLRRIPDTNKIMGNTSCGNPKAFWKKTDNYRQFFVN